MLIGHGQTAGEKYFVRGFSFFFFRFWGDLGYIDFSTGHEVNAKKEIESVREREREIEREGEREQGKKGVEGGGACELRRPPVVCGLLLKGVSTGATS